MLVGVQMENEALLERVRGLERLVGEGWGKGFEGGILRNFEEVESARCDTGKFWGGEKESEELEGGRVRIGSEDIHVNNEGVTIDRRKDS
jgi:hypothetical protein